MAPAPDPPLPPSDRATFDRLLAGIIDQLPEPWSSRLAEVGVIVEDHPSTHLRSELGLEPDQTLLGLHQGVPDCEASVEHSGLLPPRIYLFRGPIWDEADALDQPVEVQIRITLLHELGHQFGLDEDDLEAEGFA